MNNRGLVNPSALAVWIALSSASFYSKKEDKDVRAWPVTFITDEREYVEGMLGDLINYIDINSGVD